MEDIAGNVAIESGWRDRMTARYLAVVRVHIAQGWKCVEEVLIEDLVVSV